MPGRTRQMHDDKSVERELRDEHVDHRRALARVLRDRRLRHIDEPKKADWRFIGSRRRRCVPVEDIEELNREGLLRVPFPILIAAERDVGRLSLLAP